MTNNITKAKKAQIKLGDIEIDVYQLPDGSYRLSSLEITKIIGKSHKNVGEFLEGKSPQAAPYKDMTLGKFKVEGRAGSISEVTLELASAYWSYWARKGNEKAFALIEACLTEALERRADSAFGRVRTEEERNQRLQARMDGILSRNFWTDTIAWYLENNEVSDNYRKFLYPNVSDAVNRAFVGLAARRIEARLPEKKKVRDCLPAEMLKQIDAVERMAGLAVTNRNKEPLEAIKEAIAFVNPTPDSSWLD